MLKVNQSSLKILFRDDNAIFLLILIINIAYLLNTRFYPTMDGPAHLYNSNLIRHLLLGNSFIGEFYQLNSFPIPNWATHFLLTIFGFIMPGWLSEKMLLILYISGMALSFRYLIKTLKPDNIALTVFIFPFIYSFLFHLGFYNYALSFIFLFFSIGYWINNYWKNHLSLYVITGILLLCTYFSNVLSYAFLGITLGSIIFLMEAEVNPLWSRQYFAACLNRIKRLTLCSLPGLILLLWFFSTVSFQGSEQRYAASQLLKWTNDVRSLIVFSYAKEEIITEQFLHILLFLLILSIILNKNRFSITGINYNTRKVVALFPLVLSIVLLFVLPDGSSAGMMSDRLSLMTYIFFIILVITQTLPRRIQLLFSLVAIALHITLLTKHTTTLQELNANAKAIHETAKHLDANTIVLPVNLSDNWLEPHFSNYLGTDKPMVILENYEVTLGWFPVQWNTTAPSILLGDHKSLDIIPWYQSNNNKARQIDYIFLYGKTTNQEDEKLKALSGILSADFTLAYESEDKYTQLYKRKQSTDQSTLNRHYP